MSNSDISKMTSTLTTINANIGRNGIIIDRYEKSISKLIKMIRDQKKEIDGLHDRLDRSNKAYKSLKEKIDGMSQMTGEGYLPIEYKDTINDLIRNVEGLWEEVSAGTSNPGSSDLDALLDGDELDDELDESEEIPEEILEEKPERRSRRKP